ncbi:MAG: heavy-metal-associated domain-containing protein [Rhodospirillales bacterium]|nr:heavy-metal-associated domain-containing protein [Rhodospirillales bacterium]
MDVVYRVEGMSCGGCVNSVTKAIQAVAPSAMVSVELETKRVTVTGIDDDDMIRQAVENAGFDFGGRI